MKKLENLTNKMITELVIEKREIDRKIKNLLNMKNIKIKVFDTQSKEVYWGEHFGETKDDILCRVAIEVLINDGTFNPKWPQLKKDTYTKEELRLSKEFDNAFADALNRLVIFN